MTDLADAATGSRWLAVWTRATVIPAWRRAAAVWIGAGIGGGVVFGPTGMHPADLAALAFHVPAVGAALALTWFLVFLPTARVLVRAETARFLYSLPGPRAQAQVVAALALLALQLPWLALWTIGAGLRGLVFVVGESLLLAAVARWQPAPRTARFPPWTRAFPAYRGILVRALKRRGADAIIRGIGLAILAGLVGGLFVRNNALAGTSAGVVATCVIAVVLIAGWAGVLAPLVEALRSSTWLASSLGISRTTQIAALAIVVAGVYLAGATVAVLACSAAFGFEPWIVVLATASALGMALVATRALLVAEHDVRGGAVRIALGAIVASALCVLLLGWLGAIGAAVLVAAGLCALLATPARSP